ncbi:uncharacterized protein LOC128386248 [Panonychus citri]|uniref:uncharacterized protein LOC128386248 n=1 Tax=Panonychus citri TaxID=50023 RepID=UPI002308047A|nr:uncharacterized protein LOC128386248 [Panonychus citri]
MSLNDLPENCLWLIFGNSCSLEELIQLAQVCSKWSNLISMRLEKVKYLVRVRPLDHFDYTKIWVKKPTTVARYNLRELLPNLRILTIPCLGPRDQNKIRALVNCNSNIKGLVGLKIDDLLDLKNVEMVTMDNAMFDYKHKFQPDQLKQIRFFSTGTRMRKLHKYVQYFPNLKRLNFNCCERIGYYGPQLSNLKILESYLYGWDGDLDEFYLLDFCPSLESAFIKIAVPYERVDSSIKNYNLRDLVIEISRDEQLNWRFVRALLSKFLIYIILRLEALVL